MNFKLLYEKVSIANTFRRNQNITISSCKNSSNGVIFLPINTLYSIYCFQVQELGGVPVMLKCSDMSNTIPDEKVVITYVSYLCARLLDIRQETRAARVIQAAWRAFSLRKHAANKQVNSRNL